MGEGLHDGGAVASVLLVDGLDDAGVTLGPGVGLGGRVVLLGPVVDDDDLDVLGVAGSLEDGLDAVVHVVGGVVAGDAKRDYLVHVVPLGGRVMKGA